MRNKPFLTLGVLALTTTLHAQTLFEIHPGCTTHTSRGTLVANGGEILLQVPGSHFMGVGHVPNGLSCAANGMRFVMQDQDAASTDTYWTVVRGDLLGVPDCSSAGLLMQVGPFNPPSGTGVSAWIFTHTFASPVAIPQCATFYPGVAVRPAPTWPADGLSLHIAMYSTGSNASASASNLFWNCGPSGPAQPATKRTINLGLLVDAAVLNMGGADALGTRCIGASPDFGAGGNWPVCEGTTGTMRNDALHARVRDAALPAGFCAVYAWPLTACASAYPWPVADGAWYLSPGYSGIWIGGGVLAGGEAVVPTLLTSAVVSANCALLSLPMYYQGIVVQGGVIHATNRAGTVFGLP